MNETIKYNIKRMQPIIQQTTKNKQIKSDMLAKTKQKNIETYGFSSNPSQPLWKNLEDVIKNMTKLGYLHRPSQMSYHDLCRNKQPPKGIGLTLGLGLKFCIQTNTPPPNLNKSYTRFINDVRKRYIFAGIEQKDTPKKLYIKSQWTPEKTDDHMEGRLNNFIYQIQKSKNEITKRNKTATNLTTLQQKHIKMLNKDEEFIILMADKNLGPCIMERGQYILNILHEHLDNTSTYSRLSTKDGTIKLSLIKRRCNDILKRYITTTTTEEKQYFAKQLDLKHRIPQFYGTPKVHKNKEPTPFRPVVSQCGSLSAIISKCIDYKLQPFTHSIPSYIKNSSMLLDKLDKFKTLPKGAKLFTSDATSMYTNIDPDEGLRTLKKYINTYKDEIKGTINSELICDMTELVMRNNVFQFGNTWWHQQVGTAMGTPCACIYATIFFAWFERQHILKKYQNNLLLYKRQIDDIFGIWIEDEHNPNRWNEFKKDLNQQCKLEWNTEELDDKVNFLDLTINIDKKGKISYQTFQKPMNPFLYIPGHSSHPPGIVKSLIHGLIQTYHRQNKQQHTFNKNVRQLFQRLLARGHLYEDIYPTFLKAAEKIDSKNNNTAANRTHRQRTTERKINRNDIFFHLPYHPRDISRKQIHHIYENTCNAKDNLEENFQYMDNGMGGTMHISKLTIAYSRGQNLRDVLCSSKLKENDTCKVSNFLTI